MNQELHRTSHVVIYIKTKYPRMDVKKYDVVKIGPRIYLYAINVQGNLQRHMIYRGDLSAINQLAVCKRSLDQNIQDAIVKLGYL